jgi:small subunit ribosomal protein S8
MTDPIADFLTRIRNAITARKAKVQIPSSRLKLRLAEVLRDEGFVNGVRHEDDGKQGTITVELRYDQDNRNAIEGLRRVSRPGQRSYVRHQKLPKVRSGLGVAIVTTSQGVMTERAARKAGLGGELLCEVW